MSTTKSYVQTKFYGCASDNVNIAQGLQSGGECVDLPVTLSTCNGHTLVAELQRGKSVELVLSLDGGIMIFGSSRLNT